MRRTPLGAPAGSRAYASVGALRSEPRPSGPTAFNVDRPQAAHSAICLLREFELRRGPPSSMAFTLSTPPSLVASTAVN